MKEYVRARIAQLQKAIEHSSDPAAKAQSHELIGGIYLQYALSTRIVEGPDSPDHGYRDQAIRQFQRVLEIIPQHIDARNKLAGLMLLGGRAEGEVWQYLEKIENPVWKEDGRNDTQAAWESPYKGKLHLDPERKARLREFSDFLNACYDKEIYYESERRMLRGVAHILSGQNEKSCVEFREALSEKVASEIPSFPSLAIFVMQAIRMKLNEEMASVLRDGLKRFEVFNKSVLNVDAIVDSLKR